MYLSVQEKLIPNTKALRNVEEEPDTYDEYRGVTVGYRDKIKQMASQVRIF